MKRRQSYDFMSDDSSPVAFDLHSADVHGAATWFATDWSGLGLLPSAPSVTATFAAAAEAVMPERALRDVDASANKYTTAALAIGGSLSANVGFAYDKDWIRVELTKGQTYSFSMVDAQGGGGTLQMGDIGGIMDASGRLILGTSYGSADSSGETVTYTAKASGTHFLQVGGIGIGTGSYLVTAALAEKVAPVIASISPATGASAVAASSDIVINFSEKVHAGLGFATLTGSNGQVLKIAMSDMSQVTFDGTKVTVNPRADLAAGVTYKLALDTDAVRDFANNKYVGGIAPVDTFSVAAPVVSQPAPVPVAPAPTGALADSWNVMVYIAGDNNLESYGISDLNELESVLGLPSNVKVSVLFDRAPGYSTANGDWTDTRVGMLTYDGTSWDNATFAAGKGTWESWGEQDTGAGATLTRFINWSTSKNVAANNALVVWNHGGGLSGSAWDSSSSNDNLNNKELASAIAASSVKKFDVLNFDCCLMQMAEVNHALSPYAKYIVASEDLVPGNGQFYDKILKTFVNDSSVTGAELASSMANSFNSGYLGYSGIQMSAIDTAKFGTLVTDVASFVSRAMGLDKAGSDWNALRTAANAAYEFGGGSYNYSDLKGFVSGYITSAGAAADAQLKSLASTIIGDVGAMMLANGGSSSAMGGISVYLPKGADAVSSSYTSANYSWNAATHWDQLLPYL